MPCVFCAIVAGKTDGDVQYQDEFVTAFRDIRPQAPTHLLIVPNDHISSMNELNKDGNSLLTKMFATAQHLAESEGIAERGYRLVINAGPEAGQVVDHMHLHLLGGKPMRLEGMALRFRDEM